MGRSEFLVLGAGIAGTALAAHLAERGRSVTLVEPRAAAAGATGRAAGIVTEQVWSDWDVAVIREAHAEARALLAEAEPTAYWRNGFVRWTVRNDLHVPLRAAEARLRRTGTEVRILEARELAEVLPGSRWPSTALGLFGPSDACVTPSALAERYIHRAEAAGARLVVGESPGKLPRATADGWAWQSRSEDHTAERLVVAAGAWSKALLARLEHPIPLCPYRTQAALLRPAGNPAGSFPSSHDIDTDVYVRPELGGRILAGDGTESTEADPERFVPGGDAAFLAHVAEALAEPFPRWADASVVSSWAGVCSATPDRRPLVGPVGTAGRLFVMAGFNGFGVMRAGGVARRLADALGKDPSSPATWAELAPVLPGRFPGPVPPFPPRPGFTLEGGDRPRF